MLQTIKGVSVTQIPLILLLFLISIASGSVKEQIDGGVSVRYTVFLSIRVWTVSVRHQILSIVMFVPPVVWFCLNQNSFSLVHLSTLFIYYVFNYKT